MLKDSLLEAIDAKVFYVMIGLSLLVTLVAATVTFTPQPGAAMVIVRSEFGEKRSTPRRSTPAKSAGAIAMSGPTHWWLTQACIAEQAPQS